MYTKEKEQIKANKNTRLWKITPYSSKNLVFEISSESSRNCMQDLTAHFPFHNTVRAGRGGLLVSWLMTSPSYKHLWTQIKRKIHMHALMLETKQKEKKITTLWTFHIIAIWKQKKTKKKWERWSNGIKNATSIDASRRGGGLGGEGPGSFGVVSGSEGQGSGLLAAPLALHGPPQELLHVPRHVHGVVQVELAVGVQHGVAPAEAGEQSDNDVSEELGGGSASEGPPTPVSLIFPRIPRIAYEIYEIYLYKKCPQKQAHPKDKEFQRLGLGLG